jgi:FkbM family methyltransferase
MEMHKFIYGSHAFKTFMQNHSHEKGEVEFLNSIAREGMTAIDVGANIGISSVTIARKIMENGKLYAFEPLTEYFCRLKENISLNGLENVNVYQMALTDLVGTVDYYQKELSSGIIFREGLEKLEVPTTNLDRFASEEKTGRIDLISMDCEGSELLVLEGGEETLKHDRPKIFCEIHHDFLKQLGQSVGDIVKYLRKLNFEVLSVSLDDLSMGSDFEECDYIYACK